MILHITNKTYCGYQKINYTQKDNELATFKYFDSIVICSTLIT